MYYTLIYPHIHYCNINYGRVYHTHIKPLIVVQKGVIRILSGKPYLAYTKNIFYQQSILRFTDIYKYLTALYMFKFFEKFESFPNHNYSTRDKFLLHPKFQRSTVTQQSIAYRGPKIWSSLPDCI